MGWGSAPAVTSDHHFRGWGGGGLELGSTVLFCAQTGMLGQKKIGSELGGD